MSEENTYVLQNGRGDGGFSSECSDDEIFLFTSESVGEGHPGKQNFNYF